jgi:hypothetical protein
MDGGCFSSRAGVVGIGGGPLGAAAMRATGISKARNKPAKMSG